MSAKTASLHSIHVMMAGLATGFWISPVTLLPVLFMIILAITRVPAIPSLGLGALFAIALGWLHNPHTTITQVTHLIVNYAPNKFGGL